MLLEELLKDEREVGRKEGLEQGMEQGRSEGIFQGMANSLLMFLSKFGVLPEELQKKISEEKNEKILQDWIKTASQAASLEEFISKM